jgi:uncharacterized RDD family membrane protein YckC
MVEPDGRGTTATPTAIGAGREDRPIATSRVYAGTRRRAIAYLVDGIVVGLIVFGVAALLNVLLGPTLTIDRTGRAPRLVVDDGRTVINTLCGVAVGAAYFVGSWARTGQTPGQRLFGLRVERAETARLLGPRGGVVRWVALGGPIGLLSLAARDVDGAGSLLTIAVAAWFLLLLLSTARGADNQGIHDRLAGSVVIAAGDRRPPP